MCYGIYCSSWSIQSAGGSNSIDSLSSLPKTYNGGKKQVLISGGNLVRVYKFGEDEWMRLVTSWPRKEVMEEVETLWHRAPDGRWATDGVISNYSKIA